MPEWAALGVKSSTIVAPIGAPGSAPSSPQPAPPAARTAAASSAATRLIRRETLVALPNPDRLPPAYSVPEEPRRQESAGTRTFGLSGRADRHIALVFFITSVVVLFVATGVPAQFGSDFAVVGLVHAFLLFGLIVMFGVASGGHFNPAVTLAAAAIKRISPRPTRRSTCSPSSRAACSERCSPRGCCSTRGAQTHYGAAEVSKLAGGAFQGSIVEAIGTFCLVLVILAAVYSRKSFKEWAPLAIGTTLGFIVMVGGPLTGC